MSTPDVPAAPLAAAMAAAWPGLPAGMTLEEAERRTRVAIAAAYPHLIAAADEATRAAYERVMEYADQPSTDSTTRRMIEGAARHVLGKGPVDVAAMFGPGSYL